MSSVGILGQAAPAATTVATLHTAGQPAFAQIIVCNRSSTPATYRVALRKAGATLADQHYVAYDAPLKGNETRTLSFTAALAVTDVISVYASTANVSFTAQGVESP